jgi:signal transduction histidine kinase
VTTPAAVEAARRAQRPVRLALALLVCVIVALVVAGSFAAWRLYTEANKRYQHQAIPVYGAAHDVLVQMLNEETGIRGYVISADRSVLDPYLRGRTQVGIDLDTIERGTGFDADISEHLATARREVRTLNRFFEQQIALVRSGPAGQRRAQARLLLGKTHFDRFRAAALALDGDASDVVTRAHRDQHNTLIAAFVFLGFAGVLAIGIAIALLLTVPQRLFQLYRQERAARRAAEQGADAARALAHVRDAVLLLDGESEAVRYWNPAAGALFGLNDGDGRSDDIARTLEELRRGREQTPGPRPVTLDGDERWLSYAETQFDGGRVVVLRDVTDDQRLERLRADFVATAAHELRTPLAAVYGAARTLRRDDRELSPEVSEQFLSMIETEAERLKLLMDQLLVSAQLDRDDVKLQREAVDLGSLCKSLISSVELRKPESIELDVDCPDDDLCVDGDPERLRQVVANLLDNAIKYSPDGGRVAVRIYERGGFGVLEVRDHGIGIPHHEQQRIFEKFYRLDPSMTSGVGGSGLGLYISRELVQQMGGLLSVKSELGEGSTFSIMLPLSDKMAA